MEHASQLSHPLAAGIRRLRAQGWRIPLSIRKCTGQFRYPVVNCRRTHIEEPLEWPPRTGFQQALSPLVQGTQAAQRLRLRHPAVHIRPGVYHMGDAMDTPEGRGLLL